MLVLLAFPSIWVFALLPGSAVGPCLSRRRQLCLCDRDGVAMFTSTWPYLATSWSSALKRTPSLNSVSLPDSSAATIPCVCGNRWGLYGPVIPASRHHSRSTGALYAPEVYGASGEGWVHFHHHLCLHLTFCPFQFPSNNIHIFRFFFVIVVCFNFFSPQVTFSPLSSLIEHFFLLAVGNFNLYNLLCHFRV